MKLYALGFNSHIIMPIIQDMKTIYTAKMAGKYLEVYIQELQDKERLVFKDTSQKLRPQHKEDYAYGLRVLETVLNDVRKFLLERPFYSRKGVPHRRGHLYYGKCRLLPRSKFLKPHDELKSFLSDRPPKLRYLHYVKIGPPGCGDSCRCH